MSFTSLLEHVVFSPYDYRSTKIDINALRLVVIHIPDQIGDAMSIFPIIRSLESHKIPHLIIVSSVMNKPVFDSLTLKHTRLTVIAMTFQDNARFDEIKAVAINIREQYGTPDLCIEAMRKKNFKTLFFIKKLRAKTNFQVVGLALRCFSPACKIPSRMDQFYRAPVPMTWAIMMREAGFPAVRPIFEFPLGEDVLTEVRCQTRPLGKYIAINLEGSVEERTFSLSTAIELVALIKKTLTMPIVIVHSPKGINTAAALISQYDNVYRLDLPPSIKRSAAVIKDAMMTITPDTSILHMASAYNIPTLAIYANYKTRWPVMQDIAETIVVGKNISHINLDEFEQALDRLTRRAGFQHPDTHEHQP